MMNALSIVMFIANGRSTPPVPGARAATAMTIAAKPTPDPTDRSNWPEMRSSVAGQAMIPTTDTFCRMLMRLSLLRKNGDAIEKKMNSAARTTTRAAVSGTDRPRPLRRDRRDGGVDAAGAAGVDGAGAGVGLGSCVVTWVSLLLRRAAASW